MHRQFAICAAVLSLSCAGSGVLAPATNSTSASSEVIAVIEASEQARRAAARAGTYETAMRYLAPEFFFVHSTGQVDDGEKFRAFAERVGGAGGDARSLLEEPIYVVSDDLVVRTQLTSSRPRANLPEAHTRSLDVFVRRAGTWQWLAHQSTTVQPPWREASVPAAVLAEYAGTYTGEDGQARVYTSRAGTLLQGPLRQGGADVPLLALSEATFAVPRSAVTVTFLRNRFGQVATVQLVGPLGLSVYTRK